MYRSSSPGLMTLPEILLTAMAVAVTAQPAEARLELWPRRRLPHCGSPWRYLGVPSREVGNFRPSSSRTGRLAPRPCSAAAEAVDGEDADRDACRESKPSALAGTVSFCPARMRLGLER